MGVMRWRSLDGPDVLGGLRSYPRKRRSRPVFREPPGDKITGMTDLIAIAEARRRVLEAVHPLAAEAVALERGARPRAGRGRGERRSRRAALRQLGDGRLRGGRGPGGRARRGRRGARGPSRPAARGGRARRCAISTGAVVPEGADAVVPVERTERGAASAVRVPATEAGRRTSAAPGEDMRAGRGCVLQRRHAARARRAGRGRVGRAAPTLALRAPARAWPLLVTGDELTEPGRAARRPGGSTARTATRSPRRSSARAASWWPASSVPDDAEATRAALGEALEDADVVCVSGGVSVGPHDHVKPALARARRRGALLGRAACGPGKPTWFGARGEHARVRPARQPGVGDGHLPAVRAPGAGRAAGRRPRRAARRRALLDEADRPQPAAASRRCACA